MFKRMRARSSDPVYSDPLNFDVNLDQSFDDLLFRTRFIEAAASLAQQLDIAVENLGLLFDRVLSTGTKGRKPLVTREVYEEKLDDWESDYGKSIHGISLKLQGKEGVVLFLVRKISGAKPFYHLLDEREHSKTTTSDTVESYQAKGYRMAESRFFAKAFADRVGVEGPEMEVFLSACKTFARRGAKANVQRGGIYVSAFGLRPGGRGREEDLEVLVYNFAHHLIPSFRLPELDQLMTPTMVKWVKSQAGKTLREVLNNVNAWIHLADEDIAPEQKIDHLFVDFMAALSVSLEGLISSLRVWPTFPTDARLFSEIVHLPGPTDQDLPIQTIVFGIVLPMPDNNIPPAYSQPSEGTIMPEIEPKDMVRTDRPPHPFIYTPFSLFVKAHSQIHRGPRWRAHARLTTAELSRLYPPLSESPADFPGDDRGITPSTSVESKISINRIWSKGAGAGPAPDMDMEVLDNRESPLSMFSRKTAQSSQHDLEKGMVRINDSLSLLRIPDDGNKSKRPSTSDRVRELVETIYKPGKDHGKLDEGEGEPLKGNYSHEFAWVRDVHDG